MNITIQYPIENIQLFEQMGAARAPKAENDL